MNGKDMDTMREKIKENIKLLINNQNMSEAEVLLNEYFEMVKDDAEAYSFKSVILMSEGKEDEALKTVVKGLKFDASNCDLNYNAGYICLKKEMYSDSLFYFQKVLDNCTDEKLKSDVKITVKNLRDSGIEPKEKKKKIAFFVKPGMDGFLKDVIDRLSDEYETRKIIVKNYDQIDDGMKWADISWFEWCDELVIYGSRHKFFEHKKIICRLHRYEALTNYPQKVKWENVDTLIIVTNHLLKFLEYQIPDIRNKVNIVTVKNGLNLKSYKFRVRKKGYNIAYIGYIHARKNPSMLLQIINELVKKDSRYKLFIAGKFQEPIIEAYLNDQINKMNLKDNVIFEGWQKDIGEWLEDKNYILSSSLHESFGYGIAEAMACGIKPIIHDFPFSEEIWDRKYVFSSIDRAVKMIEDENYSSEEYRNYIKDNYSLDSQINNIKNILSDKEEKIEDLTVMIPLYNRAEILKKNIENGLVLGNVKKVIVDDFSDKHNRKVLRGIKKGKYGLYDIVYHDKNMGVAETYHTFGKHIDTKYVIGAGDDDRLICKNFTKLKKDMEVLNMDYNIIASRFVYNMIDEGNIAIGYDRSKFNDKCDYELLNDMFITGEMQAFNAGSIYSKDYLKKYHPERMFRVSEDYVLFARILGNNLNKKFKITDDYYYVRRITDKSLSSSLNKEKLALNILSMLVSGYYCLKNKIITSDVLMDTLIKRGTLLQKLYGFGFEYSKLVVEYLEGKLQIDSILNFFTYKSDKIPKEFIEIKKLIKYKDMVLK